MPEVMQSAPVDDDKDQSGRNARRDEVFVVLIVLDGVQKLR